ncbi:hypothetical protein M407DRAFT_246790 [Tulasnella calospora MUT 4182]|uniref:Uncharacterized protein n=1 Tax=Tulasnella calospora MUT 4182 TaxID=1051891 RepID=A0A0C3K7B3_9AGAM|nr:hypothetical protein M407DRAFT_246790 [Tulasnella calospora MUT 4182]
MGRMSFLSFLACTIWAFILASRVAKVISGASVAFCASAGDAGGQTGGSSHGGHSPCRCS